jgi:prophage antirepressor-like protein
VSLEKFTEMIKKTSKKEGREFVMNLNKYLASEEKNIMDLGKTKTDINVYNFKGHYITILYVNGIVYFRARDVALMLEYKDTVQAIRYNVGFENKKTYEELLVMLEIDHGKFTGPISGNEDLKTIYINEGGLNQLIANSSKKEAKGFQDWIATDLLIKLRKDGTYTVKESDPINITKGLIEGPQNFWNKNRISSFSNKSVLYIGQIDDNIYKFGQSSDIKIYKMLNI